MDIPQPTGDPIDDLQLGLRIRELRKSRGLSGRALAQTIGVSSGFISQVEMGDTTPSVANLVRIAQALDVQVGDLFDAPRPAGTVLRDAERQPYVYPHIGITEERLCVHPQLEVVIVTLDPGGSTGAEAFTHGTDVEFVHVLTGEATIVLGDDEHHLRRGDSIRFPGSVSHGCRNASDQPAQILWAITPGQF